ncbi:hypothetical protein PIIN_05722 [Serendipita indica DSM 11827]|uniref:LysM domain-containing protein n=1 Tax=Serendipita indica (strain DSM 11827) TaxID=1109443 RepID=G4TKE4_SERID|nr:hypothetical protein PIIN_05722 [Serendipita indica DSM 11827]
MTFVRVNTPIAICWDTPTPWSTPSGAITFSSSATPSPPGCITYWSAPGDTCDSIAAKFGLSATEVKNRNSFLNCADIWTNTPISICNAPVATTSSGPVTISSSSTRIPTVTTSSVSITISSSSATATMTSIGGCFTYWSVSGDTCDSIGAQYGVSASEIKNYNDFVNCNDIWPNTPIFICSSRPPTATLH